MPQLSLAKVKVFILMQYLSFIFVFEKLNNHYLLFVFTSDKFGDTRTKCVSHFKTCDSSVVVLSSQSFHSIRFSL